MRFSDAERFKWVAEDGKTGMRAFLSWSDVHSHMSIIDAHCHVPYKERDLHPTLGVEFTRAALRRNMETYDISAIVSPTSYSPQWNDGPLIREHDLTDWDKNIHFLLGINPLQCSAEGNEGIERARELMLNGTAKGLKVYLGYYHVPVTDERYLRFFEVANELKRPVMLHTGDTHYKTGKLRYSHPLGVDDIAVDFPDARFIIAHLGNPWTVDAAAVVYKNANVFTDLSGMFIGSEMPPSLRRQVRDAYEYVDNPSKFLFGTDWPVCEVGSYIEEFKKTIPERDHELFFRENALKVYDVPRE